MRAWIIRFERSRGVLRHTQTLSLNERVGHVCAHDVIYEGTKRFSGPVERISEA